MANFNLNDYELIEVRLARFYEAHPDGRVITENLTTIQDRQVSTWVVKATIYLTSDDQLSGLAKATGMAFEVDGQAGANKTSALENCETSAIGRALANMSMSGNKRASREEMEKVARNVTPAAAKRDWLVELDALASKEAARKLYTEARASKADAAVLEAIKAKGEALA